MISTKIDLFNPDRVAYFETAGWRAYYDRQWLKVLWLILQLCQEQFRIPFPLSLVAAYDVTRAAAAWAPLEHDTRLVQAYYEKFYVLARRYSGLEFDPAKAAELETQYNDDHRRLVGNPDKTAFIQTMAELHSALFGIPVERAYPSAELRVLAANTVDLITGGTSSNVESDWIKIEEYLRQCYRSIQAEVSSLVQ